jgi:cell wall-associated NlpC family hydrolase
VQLPRVSSDDANVGKPVRRDDLGPGDLVLFEDSTGYVHHVGIYVGEGRFVHAPHTGDVVKLSSLDEPYYARQFAGGRRIG